MALRLYLGVQVDQQNISPAFDSTWEKTSEADRALTLAVKNGGSMANKASLENVSTNPYDFLNRQYVSPPLAAQNISGTVKLQVRALESALAADFMLAVVIKAVSYDGSVVRGTLLSYFPSSLGSPEYNTSARNISLTAQNLTALNVQAGDRLVIEIGTRSFNTVTTSRTATMSFGDNNATDLPENNTTTAANNPWIEFSQDIAFQPVTDLRDDFDDNSIDTSKWGTAGSGTVTETGGKMELRTANSTAGSIAVLYSPEFYDLTGKRIFAPFTFSTSGNLDNVFSLEVPDQFNRLFFLVTGTTLLAIKSVNGSDTTVASTTYNSTTHKYLGIREDSGTVYFDYSSDGVTWNNLGSTVAPFSVRTLRCVMLSVQNVSTASPGVMVVDDFNIDTTIFPVVKSKSTYVSPTSDATSFTITGSLPSGITAGDLLVAIVSADGNPTLSASGWNKLGQDSNGALVTGAVFWKIAVGSDTLVVTSSASEQISATMYRIANAIGVIGINNNGSSIDSDPLLLPTYLSKLYLWIATRSGDSTVVASAGPVGFGDLQTATAGGANGASTNSATRLQTGQAINPGTFTSATEQWVTWTLAIIPNDNTPIVIGAGTAANTGQSSSTISVTTPEGWSNTGLLVFTDTNDANSGDRNITSIAYNGDALSKLREYDSGGSVTENLEAWFLANPDVGTANLISTYGGACDFDSVYYVIFANVASSQPDASNDNEVTTTTATISVTTVSDNSVVVSVAQNINGSINSVSPQYDIGDRDFDVGSIGNVTGTAGVVTHSYTSGVSDTYTLLAVAIKLHTPLSTLTASFTVDGIILSTATKTFTADGIILVSATTSFTVDAIVAVPTPLAFTADAIVSASATKTFTIDGIILSQTTKTFTVDAIISGRISDLKENFNSGDYNHSDWTTTGTFIIDGQLVFDFAAPDGQQERDFISTKYYSLIGDSFSFEVVDPVEGTNVDLTWYVSLDDQDGSHVDFLYKGNGQIEADYTNLSLADQAAYGPTAYDHASYRFLRFREDSGTVYFEGSVNGQVGTWNILGSVALSSIAANLNAVRVTFYGIDETGFNTKSLIFDNINYVPTLNTFTVDGIVYTTATQTFTADGIISETSTKTFTIDAIIQTQGNTSTFTADALILATSAANFTIDGIVLATATSSFTTDAIILVSNTTSFTVDGLVLSSTTTTFTVDALVLATTLNTFTADAIVLETKTNTFTIDGIVKEEFTSTFTIDGLVQINNTATFTIDGIILVAQTSTFTIDAIILTVNTFTFTIDGIVLTVGTVTFTTDGIILVATTNTFTIDGIVLETKTNTFTVDAIVQTQGNEITFTVDALIQANTTSTFTVDAIILATQSASFTIDGIVLVVVTNSFTVDAVIQTQTTATFTVDGLIKVEGNEISFTADSIVQVTQIVTFTVDAVIKEIHTQDFTIDGIILASTQAQFTVDGIILVATTSSFTVDAIIFETKTATFTVDAVIQTQGNTTTFTADGIVLTVVTLTVGNALNFNGSNQAITYGNILTSQTVVSAAVLFRVTGTPSTNFDVLFGYGNTRWFFIWNGATRRLGFNVRIGGVEKSTTYPASDLDLNTPYVAVASYDPNGGSSNLTISVYDIQGNLIYTQASTQTGALSTTAQPLQIAHDPNRNFYNKVDVGMVAVWDRALTQAEKDGVGLLQLPPQGLILLSDFSEGTGTTIADTIGGETGTFIGSPTWIQGFRPFIVDGIILATTEATFTIDAIIFANNEISFTVDAVIFGGGIVSLTVDGIIFATNQATFTTDAIVLTVVSQSFTVDGIVLTINTSTFTTDAIVTTLGNVSNFTVDAIIFAQNVSTFTVDAIVLVATSISFTVDGIIYAQNTATITLDGIVLATTETTFTVDGVVQIIPQLLLTVDGIILATQIASFTVDAIVLVVFTSTFTVDAIIQSANTSTFTVDGIVKETKNLAVAIILNETLESAPSGLLASSAVYDSVNKNVLLTPATNNQNGSLRYDANLGNNFEVEFDLFIGGGSGADGVGFFWGTSFVPTDENNTNGNGYLVTIDEYTGDLGGNTIQIRYGNTTLLASVGVEFNIDDSVWRKVRISVAGEVVRVYYGGVFYFEFVDSSVRSLSGIYYGWVARTGGLNNEHRIKNLYIFTPFTVDGIVQERFTSTFTIDGIVSTTVANSFTVDGIVLAPTTSSITVDGIVKSSESATFTTDGIVLVVASVSFTVDAIIKVATEADFTVDAVVQVQASIVFTTDAIILVKTDAQITIDAILIEIVSATFTADGVVFASNTISFTVDALIIEREGIQISITMDGQIALPHLGGPGGSTSGFGLFKPEEMPHKLYRPIPPIHDPADTPTLYNKEREKLGEF